VITEDDHIDHALRTDIAGLFPPALAAKLQTSHFLFLGYGSPRDWDSRMMLHRLWGDQEGKNFKSWAIREDPTPIERAAWNKRGIDILSARLENFVTAVEQRLTGQRIEHRIPAQRLPTQYVEQRLST
jgi:hypothetical protein